MWVIIATNSVEPILQKLVSFRTVSGDASASYEAIAYVADFLEARGMAVAIYECDSYRSLVATAQPGIKRPLVMLYAHIDVVPGGEELWQLRKQDGRFYGRGVFDMKFALAAYLALVDELANELPDYNLGIMVVSDEEIGGAHGAGHLVELGYMPEVCIMPDGGEGWNIEAYAKGYLRLKVETHGVSAHGSRPWEGDNALVTLMALLNDLGTVFPDNRNPEANTMNIGYIRGGDQINQIPDYAEAGLDVRFMSAKDEVLLMREIERACTYRDATLTVRARGSAVNTDLANPFVRAFSDAITEVTGRTPRPHRAYGASDAGIFAEKGTVCIISVPDAGGHHADGEWIDADGVEDYKMVLKKYLAAVANQHTKYANSAPISVSVPVTI